MGCASTLNRICAWRGTEGPSRRKPNHRRCRGEIFARFDSGGAGILWECPLCGDNGHISGWKGTDWDRRVPRELPDGRG